MSWMTACSAIPMTIAVAAEAMVGLALGFVLQIAFAAPLIAGEIIGGAMGIGFANMIDPNSGRSSPAIGQFLSILLTLLFLSLDGHLVLVDMILRSYQAMPPGATRATPVQVNSSGSTQTPLLNTRLGGLRTPAGS